MEYTKKELLKKYRFRKTKLIKRINKLPSPVDKTEIQYLFGMVSQIEDFIDDLIKLT
jgi:hypothetical protein